MAERIEIETITVPAGTLSTAPQTTPLAWREGYPIQVEFRIPPGPSGLVGVALLHSGRRVIPKSGEGWLITDSEPVIWPLTRFPYNASYAILAYNTDIYPHTFQVRMLLNEVRMNAPVTPPALPIVPPNVSEETEMDFPEYVEPAEEVTT